MARLLRLWDRHLVERRVPALLPPLLRPAGFEVEAIEPEPCRDSVFRAAGLARLMTRPIGACARGNQLAEPQDIEAWIAEQQRMAREGRFFLAITHHVVAARRKPR
jgi:hypothetical protein